MYFTRPPQPQSADDEVNYWVSYSDLMAALLLVFILLLIGSLVVSKAELEEQEKSLQATMEEVKRQEQTLLKQEHALETLDTNLEQVLGVRAALLERLRAQFESSDAEIHFDDATGAIQLGSGILFDEGSARLTAAGRETLERLIPVYFHALLNDDELRPHIDQIVFEGHTNSNYSGSDDPNRAYLFNLQLSQDRAYEAMKFVIAQGLGQEYDAKELLAAVGYSSSRLLYQDGLPELEDEERSRRIEIRFRLRDEESMNELRRLISRDMR